MAFTPPPIGPKPMASAVAVTIATNQTPVSVAGTMLLAGTPSISGAVTVIGTPAVSVQGTVFVSGSVITTAGAAANQSVSGTVGASIIGLTPVAVTNIPSISGTVLVGNTNLNVSGSVASFHVGNASVITTSQGSVAVAIIAGSIAATFTPPANQSVSGTVLVGNTTLNVSGSVVGFQGTNPWIVATNDSSVAVAIVSGSIAATLTPPANQSVSGAVSVSNFPANQSVSGALSVSNFPTTQNVSGSVAAFVVGSSSIITVHQSSVAVNIIAGSIAATFTPPANQSVSGTVDVNVLGGISSVALAGANTVSVVGNVGQAGTVITSIAGNVTVVSSIAGGIFPVSGSVAAVVTNFPTTQNISGSVAAFVVGSASIITASQGSVAVAIISGSIAATFTPPANQSVSGTVLIGNTVDIAGSVAATITNTNVNVSGSVAAFKLGTWITSVSGTVEVNSIVGTYAEDAGHVTADKGLFVLGVRNDAVASFTGATTEYSPIATDSAGRLVIKPFSPDDTARIDFNTSVVSTSVTLIKASAVGLRNYITDFWIANTGATTTLVTFRDGSTSIIGYAVAPTGGGFSSPGIAMPIRTAPSQDLTFLATSATSILFLSAKGYQAP